MNLNLAMPWGDKSSPPQKPELAFYSHQSEDLLFTDPKTVEIYCQAGLRSVGLTWSLHRNMIQKSFRQGTAEALPPNRYKITLDTAGLPAGFYDLRVKLDTGTEKPTDGVCTFGWKVDQMAIRDSRPADFVKFWDDAKAKLAKIPLDAKIEDEMKTFKGKEIDEYNVKSACLPPDFDPTGHRCEEVESCKISFAGPDGGRVYAWLAKPKGEGPFPAMLVLPGAGFAARPRPLDHARHGYLAIDVQIHGQNVDLPKYEPIPGYNDKQVYEPIDAYYYHNVHLRVVQAVNYLASRSDVEKERIVAAGGSQGGRLSVVIAGLDKRIKAAVPCIANSPNQPHLAWVAKCNAAKTDGMDLTEAPPMPDTADARCFAYYDPMNYAPDITCPVYFNAGLIDPVSPPFSVWAVFNRLATKDKTIVALPGMGHDWSAEFDRRAWRWLDQKLGIPPAQKK